LRPKKAARKPVSGMTMTDARMYPVETQAISSREAPRFPIMCGIATFTMDESMICMIDAVTTANAMMYLWGSPPVGGDIATSVTPAGP
jgi:hypothetical protein